MSSRGLIERRYVWRTLWGVSRRQSNVSCDSLRPSFVPILLISAASRSSAARMKVSWIPAWLFSRNGICHRTQFSENCAKRTFLRYNRISISPLPMMVRRSSHDNRRTGLQTVRSTKENSGPSWNDVGRHENAERTAHCVTHCSFGRCRRYPGLLSWPHVWGLRPDFWPRWFSLHGHCFACTDLLRQWSPATTMSSGVWPMWPYFSLVCWRSVGSFSPNPDTGRLIKNESACVADRMRHSK